MNDERGAMNERNQTYDCLTSSLIVPTTSFKRHRYAYSMSVHGCGVRFTSGITFGAYTVV